MEGWTKGLEEMAQRELTALLNVKGVVSLFLFYHKARGADIRNIARLVNLEDLKRNTKSRKTKGF